MSARLLRALGACVVTLWLAGCHHRTRPVILPPSATAPAPVPVEPAKDTAQTIPSKPLEQPPLQPVQPPRKAKRSRRKEPQAAPAAPVQVASSGVPAADPGSVIGALTVGGSTDPETRHRAEDTLAELDKRLKGLNPGTSNAKSDGLARVRRFQSQARRALKDGDADGALSLATRAKLLLDDLLK